MTESWGSRVRWALTWIILDHAVTEGTADGRLRIHTQRKRGVYENGEKADGVQENSPLKERQTKSRYPGNGKDRAAWGGRCSSHEAEKKS